MSQISPVQYAKKLKDEMIAQIRLQETSISRRCDEMIEIMEQLQAKIVELSEKGKEDGIKDK